MANIITAENFQYIMDKYIRVDMFRDQYGNTLSQPIYNEEYPIIKNSFDECIVTLTYIADTQATITVKNKLNPLSNVIPDFIDYVRVQQMPTNANEFYFDTVKNCIYFNTTQSGQDILINYYAIGKAMLSANLVYSDFDSNGNILKTLGELIRENKEALSQIVTVGNAESLRIQLEAQLVAMVEIFNAIKVDLPLAKEIRDSLVSNIALGATTATTLNTAITNAQGSISAITLADNKSFTIPATSLVYNDTSKLYEYTLLHSSNSTKLVYSLKDADGEELLNCCKEIDSNNLLVRNDEKCLINIVINKGYWGGL